MELKIINVSNILANFYQPRTKFDREKIKELSESILSNGLINPITITPDKKRKGKFMIVSGERRWQAHRTAKIKTIPCVVKEYKTDGQFMVESLIENIHREDLSDVEKAKFLKKIMKEEKINNVRDLAKRIHMHEFTIGTLFDSYGMRKTIGPIAKGISQSVISETRGLPEKERIALIKKASEEDFGSRKMREIVRQIKQEPIPEPIQYERTANDVVDDILSNLHNFKYRVDELLKSNVKEKINIEDLSKSNVNKAITTAGLHLKVFRDFVNALRQRGAKPDKIILALIKANGKI